MKQYSGDGPRQIIYFQPLMSILCYLIKIRAVFGGANQLLREMMNRGILKTDFSTGSISISCIQDKYLWVYFCK